jgi:serine/threonine protein kinase
VSTRPLPFLVKKYECFQSLGGNMAEVFFARDQKTGRDVVVKILRPADAEHEEIRQRFESEAQIGARCSQHPNIITVYDYDNEDLTGLPFIVMERLYGESLRIFMRRGGIQTQEQAVGIALQAARALGYLHRLGVVHRDIKPDNLNVEPDGRVKLLDFGVARRVDLHLTKAGQVIGTPSYMAPEQVLAKPVTPRSDIYAFGVLTYEMLTMSLPYPAATYEELYANIINAPPDRPRLESCQVPLPIVDVLLQCLAKDPDCRPASFDTLEAALLPFGPHRLREEELTLRSLSVPGPSASTSPLSLGLRTPTPRTPPGGIAAGAETVPAQVPSGRRKLMLGGALALLAAGAGLTVWVTTRPDPEPPKAKEKTALPTRIQPKGGDMVLFPAGPALIGEDRRTTEVGAFYLDVAEVSNRGFLEFCAETRHPCPASAQSAPPEAPVVEVTFDDAQTFARWAGKRLPTAVEWEKAVRGPSGRLYPWGDDWLPGAANLPASAAEADKLAPQPPAEYLRFATPEGVIHLIGNVWEWTATPGLLLPEGLKALSSLPAARALNPPLSLTDPVAQVCGGSFRVFYEEDTRRTLSYDYLAQPYRLRLPDTGFRCARDATAP